MGWNGDGRDECVGGLEDWDVFMGGLNEGMGW